MDAIKRWTLALLAGGAILALLAATGNGAPPPGAGPRPELEYLKEVNRAGPPRDPQLLFLLMGQYASANLRREGAEFVSGLLRESEARLTDNQKAMYLTAIGLLRAGAANEVPLLSRIGWVRQTITTLEEAKRLSGGQLFVARWSAGVVYARLPGFFGQRNAAMTDLTWCQENAGRAPHPGWLREVYYQLGVLQRNAGHDREAQEYLRRSGYLSFDKPTTLTTPFAEDASTGHTFSSKRIAEVVPGKVYALSGFEFTEYYFVVSGDRQELIAIDAGTRPDSAQAAYEALRAYAPGLPPLTTVFVTHSHWDHVGGHRYFQSLSPRPKFYARENYREELMRTVSTPLLKPFFGSRFSLEQVRDFKPDVTVDRTTRMRIGGTAIELIPVHGGETSDALLVNLPDQGVMFVGDFIMPYLGAPFVEEGDLDGLFDAIDIIVRHHPQHLLHGHEPLTRVFASPEMLAALKTDLAWLRAQSMAAIERGAERAAIQQANLIPPGLLAGDPDAHLPYLLMRENVINRIYDQNVGYWQPHLKGVDHLGRADRGTLLVDYLGVSEPQMRAAAQRMIADGQYELAAMALDWTSPRFGESRPFVEVKRLAYRKLAEKYQEFNPFKFILYSGKAGDEIPQMQPAKPSAAATLGERIAEHR
jgi:glyoxylase-like metal-dependent hydrolase (beta-lactamase superfamily II)